MQRFPRPQPFRVVAVTLPAALLGGLEFHARWDAIGPAYYVSSDQLTMLNRVGVVSILDPVYDVEGSQ